MKIVILKLKYLTLYTKIVMPIHVMKFQNKNIMLDRVSIVRDWAENVVPVHQVPEVLFDHQIDAMHLLRQGDNVFLGKKIKILVKS